MINEIFVETKDRMNKVIEHFSNEISVIRTGRASTNMLDVVKVDYYGSMTPLKNIANITLPTADLIIIHPFDPSVLDVIEKALSVSNLGMTPNNDGNVIRLNIPMLTEERRKELMKTVHEYAEDGKISIHPSWYLIYLSLLYNELIRFKSSHKSHSKKNIDYIGLSTDMALDTALSEYLIKRKRLG